MDFAKEAPSENISWGTVSSWIDFCRTIVVELFFCWGTGLLLHQIAPTFHDFWKLGFSNPQCYSRNMLGYGAAILIVLGYVDGRIPTWYRISFPTIQHMVIKKPLPHWTTFAEHVASLCQVMVFWFPSLWGLACWATPCSPSPCHHAPKVGLDI